MFARHRRQRHVTPKASSSGNIATTNRRKDRDEDWVSSNPLPVQDSGSTSSGSRPFDEYSIPADEEKKEDHDYQYFSNLRSLRSLEEENDQYFRYPSQVGAGYGPIVTTVSSTHSQSTTQSSPSSFSRDTPSLLDATHGAHLPKQQRQRPTKSDRRWSEPDIPPSITSSAASTPERRTHGHDGPKTQLSSLELDFVRKHSSVWTPLKQDPSSDASSVSDTRYVPDTAICANEQRCIVHPIIDPALAAVVLMDQACFDPAANMCGGDLPRCDICNDTMLSDDVGRFPCCKHNKKKGRRHKIARANVCHTCLLLLTYPSVKGSRVGRCPLCRDWIRVRLDQSQQEIHDGQGTIVAQNKLKIQAIQAQGRCQRCHSQRKRMLVESKSVCDECFLAKQGPALEYECHCCAGVQSILYPLYRYQTKPDSYSTVQWPCYGACEGDDTRWRLRRDQWERIPLRDCHWRELPPWRTLARVQVQTARADVLQEAPRGEEPSSCVLM